MEYRKLAGTDLELSVLTFGTIWFAAAPNRPDVDTEEGKKALHLALDSGVNCIHTSYEYQTRHVVSEVLSERKDAKELKHIIKVPDPDRAKTDNVFKPEYFRKLVEDALQELNADRIDLLQWIIRDCTESDVKASLEKFHAYKDDVRAIFEKLRDEGKVGYLGNFVYTDEYADEATASGYLDSLLCYYNAWDTTILPAIEKLANRNMGAVVLRPFHGGMLTSKRANRNALPEGDKFLKGKGIKKLENRDKLFEEAGLEVKDLTSFALKFVLACPSIASIITGMNTPDQVKGVLSAIDGEYPSMDVVRRTHEAMEKLGFRGEM